MKPKDSIIIPARALNLVFISNYYDGPLAGLCRLNGDLCEFQLISSKRFKVSRLTIAQKADWLITKWLFEKMVGIHWSYSDGKRRERFHARTHWNSFLANAYYAIKNGSPFKRAFKPAA